MPLQDLGVVSARVLHTTVGMMHQTRRWLSLRDALLQSILEAVSEAEASSAGEQLAEE